MSDDRSLIAPLMGRGWRDSAKYYDSIEGLTHLIHEPAAILLVVIVDCRFGDPWVGRMAGGDASISPKGIARQLVAEIITILLAKGATRIAALVEHEHQWAIDFWDSVIDLGYEIDPKFARYIANREND